MLNSILAFLFLVCTPEIDQSKTPVDDYIRQQYNLLQPQNTRPAYDLFQRGMIGYLDILASGQSVSNTKVTLIDFRMSSKQKRMWVIDLQSNTILFHVLVAHGKNTGDEFARSFSNQKNSNQSSLGFYMTAETYIGKHGLSMRLDGLEQGFNDKARSRAIVMHGANYVSQDFIKTYGRLGRSFGCPAVSVSKHKDIIKSLANGSVLFIYSPDKKYEQSTLFNNKESALIGLEKLTASSEVRVR